MSCTCRNILLYFMVVLPFLSGFMGVTSQSKQHIINSEYIPQTFYGFKILQVSDLHNTEFGDKQSKLLSAVKNASPDLIVITGDLIVSSHTDIEIAMEYSHEYVKSGCARKSLSSTSIYFSLKIYFLSFTALVFHHNIHVE